MKIHRTLEGVVAGSVDERATSRLGMQLMLAHLVSMALFMTMVLAIPAWLFAAANMILSPKKVYKRIEATGRRLQVSTLCSRGDLALQDIVAEASTGRGLLGLGQAPEPLSLAWEDVLDVRWTEVALIFDRRDGAPVEVELNLAPRQDIARLGEEIRGVWERATAGLTDESRSQDQKRLGQLEQLVGRRS